MSRLIDADKLKESIDNCDICNICPDKDARCSYDCGFPDVLDYKWEKLIDAQPTIEVPKWIPCSERLPSEETSVLVTFGYGEIGIDLHTVGWANNGWVWHDDVIAWMPLPKAYEEKDHE